MDGLNRCVTRANVGLQIGDLRPCGSQFNSDGIRLGLKRLQSSACFFDFLDFHRAQVLGDPPFSDRLKPEAKTLGIAFIQAGQRGRSGWGILSITENAKPVAVRKIEGGVFLGQLVPIPPDAEIRGALICVVE